MQNVAKTPKNKRNPKICFNLLGSAFRESTDIVKISYIFLYGPRLSRLFHSSIRFTGMSQKFGTLINKFEKIFFILVKALVKLTFPVFFYQIEGRDDGFECLTMFEQNFWDRH